MVEIDELVILLNNYCNLRCDYCTFREDHAENFQECAAEYLRQAVTLFFEQFRQQPQAPAILCFNADGEALLSRELLLGGLAYAAELRQTLRAENVLIALVTNGVLLDPPLAEALARLDVAVTVSLDGDAAAHDVHRRDRTGAATHARVVAGIRCLQAAGVPVSLRAVISPETVQDLTATYHALQALAPARPVKLRPARLKTAPALPPAWVETFTCAYLECVAALLRQGTPLVALPDDAYAFARFIAAGVGRASYCGAGRRMLWLTPSGALTICGLFSGGEEMLGHIRDVATVGDLGALLRHPFAERFRASASADAADCATCRWRPVCGGGCPALPLLSGSARPPLCGFYTALGAMLEALLSASPHPEQSFETLRSFDV